MEERRFEMKYFKEHFEHHLEERFQTIQDFARFANVSLMQAFALSMREFELYSPDIYKQIQVYEDLLDKSNQIANNELTLIKLLSVFRPQLSKDELLMVLKNLTTHVEQLQSILNQWTQDGK
jgi:hypothetical protein